MLTDFGYYGPPAGEPSPTEAPSRTTDQWLALPALDRLVWQPHSLLSRVHTATDRLQAPPALLPPRTVREAARRLMESGYGSR
jgi:hypothetical protein